MWQNFSIFENLFTIFSCLFAIFQKIYSLSKHILVLRTQGQNCTPSVLQPFEISIVQTKHPVVLIYTLDILGRAPFAKITVFSTENLSKLQFSSFRNCKNVHFHPIPKAKFRFWESFEILKFLKIEFCQPVKFEHIEYLIYNLATLVSNPLRVFHPSKCPPFSPV